MSLLKKSINVYYSLDKIDLELVKNVLGLLNCDLIPIKVDPDFRAKEISIFVSKEIDEKYYLDSELFLKEKGEVFFYNPNVKDSNLFFKHDKLSKFRESFEFSGLSYSFSFSPLRTDYKYLLFSLFGGRRALFLDRDGILNIDSGYVGDVDDLEVIDTLFPAIKKCNEKGIPVIVLTNQAGVGRGYFSPLNVEKINEKIRADLKMDEAYIDDFFISYTHPEGVSPYNYESIYRKPMHGMITEACLRHNIDNRKSLMIGDKHSDNMNPTIGEFFLVSSRYHSNGESIELVLEKIFQWLSKIRV
jgi:D-glycero-D-manno-heptose 1,7-bisphosphate phosphatase